jgi:hypothetical protein
MSVNNLPQTNGDGEVTNFSQKDGGGAENNTAEGLPFRPTVAEERQALLNQQAFLGALRQHNAEQNKVDKIVEKQQETEEMKMLYKELFFISEFWCCLIVPIGIAIMVVLSIYPINYEVEKLAPTALQNVDLVAFFVIVVIGWFVLREYYKWKHSYIIITSTLFRIARPRMVALLLLDRGPRFVTNTMDITEYRGSFLNFLPGWNSWTIKLGTPIPIQEGRSIESIKRVRNGDLLVQAIRPDFVRSPGVVRRR